MQQLETLSPAQVAYRKYLESDHWRGLRLEAFKTYGRRCSRCPATCRLDVHHLRYRYPWTSGVVTDLQILCWKCHAIEHGVITVMPAVEKKKAQKGKRLSRLLVLKSRVFSNKHLSHRERQFVHSRLMHGTKEQRRIANEIFQKNSKGKSRFKRNGKWKSHPPGLERLLLQQQREREYRRGLAVSGLSKKQRRFIRTRAKYAEAFGIRF